MRGRLFLLLCLPVFLAGCVEPEPPAGSPTQGTSPTPPASPESPVVTGQLNEPRLAHRPDVDPEMLQALPCPEMADVQATDQPRIQVALPADPWPRGEWRCITVGFDNTDDRTFGYAPDPDECAGLRLMVADPERGPIAPLQLYTVALQQPCEREPSPVIQPGESVVEHFYWRGGIVWGLDGPYVEPGPHELLARFSGSNQTWNATTSVRVHLAEGEAPPTTDCGGNPPPDQTYQNQPNIQILPPPDWPADHWVCVEAWFLNNSNRTFVVEMGDFFMDIELELWDQDGNRTRLAPPILPATAAPMHRTFEISPAESVAVVKWWYPDLGEPGIYRLTASWPAVSETWPTANQTVVRVG